MSSRSDTWVKETAGDVEVGQDAPLPSLRRYHYNPFTAMKKTLLLFLILILPSLFSGCYLLKQGTYLLSHNARSRSIERVLAADSISPDAKEMLRSVQEIRRYAVEEIGLERNRNYTRYTELDRDYVLDVVTACNADSFTPHEWRFPIFGAFPYKGFYERKDAEEEAARLESKGLDVWIREVDGFSTLGFFSDPIYSFMTEYAPFALADLIIHEQTHATVFFKDEIQFNEELATFVGREGALAFLRDRYGEKSEAYRQAIASLNDWNIYRDRVIELYCRLNRIYKLETDRDTILGEKLRAVGEFNRRLQAEAMGLFQTERFRSFEDIPANNAYIMSFVRYSRDLDLFYRLYEDNGGDLRATVEVLTRLKKSKNSPKKTLARLLAD
ncbi:MAG: aminopeptidase [Spirochaetaceae bacterium]|nr:MAG: aminopeptidase [Spirochaetaceae bacterium]